MKKKVLLLIAVAALFLCVLSACSRIDSPLIGRWEFVSSGVGIYYFAMGGIFDDIEFFANGKVMEYGQSEPGKFSLPADGRLSVDAEWENATHDFTYVINGNTLTITDADGDSASWRRAGSSANTSANADALTGRWEFLSGMVIYYFAWGEFEDIEFSSDGTVTEYGWGEPGTFTMNNGRLIVNAEWEGETYNFTTEIFENTLTIIDGDGDRATWIRR